MIKIDLNLFANLSEYLPENNDKFETFEDISVETLMTQLGVPIELTKLIFINGRRENIGYQLKNNDRVGIFPPVGGG